MLTLKRGFNRVTGDRYHLLPIVDMTRTKTLKYLDFVGDLIGKLIGREDGGDVT